MKEKRVFKRFALLLVLLLAFCALFSFAGAAAKITAPQVTSLTVAEKTTSSVTIEWKTKGKVTGYRIYSYNTKTKKYTRLRTQKSASYTCKKLTPGESYVLAVRPYYEKSGKSYKGGYFKKTVYTTLDAVTGIKQRTTEANRHKLSWNKVKGADGYEIRFYDENAAKYVTVGTVKNSVCTLSRLKSASVYKYKIRAVSTASNGKKIYSKFSPAFTAVTGAPDVTGFKQTETGESGYKLTWDAAENAQGYYLYCYSEETGDYERLAILNRTSYKITGKQSAQRDTYKIQSYAAVNGKRVFGKAVLLEAAAKPKKTELQLDYEILYNGKAKLSWDEVENADGYFIYVSSKPNSGFSLKKEISRSDLTSATMTGLGKSKTLYFKIRAYVEVGDSYIMSDYSSTVSALNFSL